MDEPTAGQSPAPDAPLMTAPKRRWPSRRLVIGLALVLGAGGVFAALWFIKDTPPASKEGPGSRQTASDGSLRLVATGDMIPHDAINSRAKKPGGYDYLAMFGDSGSLFKAADIRFCNQPTLAGGERFGISGFPLFNAPLEFSDALATVGCNLINLGSNHTNDKNQAVIDATVDKWAKTIGVLATAGANRSEAERRQIRYFSIKDTKFAFVSYTTYTNKKGATAFGLTAYDEGLATAQLAEGRAKADIVIASLRWGTEYSSSANAAQRQLAKKLADWGADVVFGHGPHVLQPVEKIKAADGREVFVWYSLGNYLHAQLETDTLFNGLAVMDISDRKITSLSYLPIYMHYEWTPQQKASQDLLARKNFSVYTIDDAAGPLGRSQLKTTLAAQSQRLQKILNVYTAVPTITKEEYFSRN